MLSVINSERELKPGEIPAFIPQFRSAESASKWEGDPKDPHITHFAAMDPLDDGEVDWIYKKLQSEEKQKGTVIDVLTFYRSRQVRFHRERRRK